MVILSGLLQFTKSVLSSQEVSHVLFFIIALEGAIEYVADTLACKAKETQTTCLEDPLDFIYQAFYKTMHPCF